MQRNKLQLTKKQIRIIFLIALAVVIMAASIILALLGSKIYKNSAAYKDQQQLYSASSYFTELIRQCEDTSDIRTATLGGKIPALVIASENDKGENTGERWIFVYDNQLKSAKAGVGDAVAPEDGDAVMPLESADFHTLRGSLLEISIITESGKSSSVNLQLTGNGGE